MTIVAMETSGFYFPRYYLSGGDTVAISGTTNATLDSTAEQCYAIGYAHIDGGGAGASKTLSNGTGAVQFLTSTVTFATAGSTIKCGVQGVDLTNGPPGRANGTWAGYGTYVQGTNAPSSAAWNSCVLGNNGTITINQGDLIAIVIEFTTRNGSDSVPVQLVNGAVNPTYPSTYNFVSPSTYTNLNSAPNMLLVADDGTLIWLEGSLIFTGQSTVAFQSGSSPNEYGNVFRLPWGAQIDAVFGKFSGAASTDITISLYSTPFGTPNLLFSKTIDYNTQGTSTSGRQEWIEVPIPGGQALTANNDYVVAVKPATTANLTLGLHNVNAISHWDSWPGGQNCYGVARASGAFTQQNSGKTRYTCGVRINGIDVGSGGAGGILVPRGMHGGIQ